MDTTRYHADVTFVTGERPPGSAHWMESQAYCQKAMADLGFSVELHDFGSLPPYGSGTGVNVIGTLPGKTKPSERVLVGAHYDHIPGCAGADDNASGVAGTLELARALANGSFARTLVVVCFDREESGLLGPEAYAARAETNGENLIQVVNFDMIGYASDDPNSQKLWPELSTFYKA